MSDTFIDGVRSVAVANGVARIELLRLVRGGDSARLEPRVVGTLMVPVSNLKAVVTHLTTTLEQIEANTRGRAGAADDVAHVQDALERL